VLKKFHIPVVMTLRDYKLVCASYNMLVQGKACEACKDGKYYHCFLKGCVKGSKAKSLLNTIEMYLHHKILSIYDIVDIFISPSRFLKTKMGEMGAKGKFVYLPNFVRVDEFQPQYTWNENSIVYFGRLSEEKGLLTLVKAMKDIPEISLKIIGEGPLREHLESGIVKNGIGNIRFLGYKSGEELNAEIRNSMFVVLPSEWYENNPRAIIEGFALGKPAVGSRIGGIPELVRDDETGFTFQAGDPEDLKKKILLLAKNPEKILLMGKRARSFVEQELNPEKHYEKLMEIYKQAM
jgi:glycosyltransferase involved in cell wall biosynthesis